MSEDCLFCKIIAGDIPGEILYEDDSVVGFRDINGKAPLHALFVPRRHIASLNEVSSADAGTLGRLMVAAAHYARQQGHDEEGFRVVMNCNEAAGQTVFHVHLHLLAGRRFSWPPG